MSQFEDKMVSIVVPIFNTREEYLYDCIESLIHQSYVNIEIIMVDDGSDQETVKVCERIQSTDNRIKLIHQRNGGVSDARNTGIKMSSGRYVMFVDSDDVISVDCVEVLLAGLVNNGSDISIAQYSKNKGFLGDTSSREHNVSTVNCKGALLALLYSKDIASSPCAKLFTKEVLKDNIFNTSLAIAEDLEFNYRVFGFSKKVTILKDSVYWYRQSEGSAMRSEFKPSRMDGLNATESIVSMAMLRGDIDILKAAKYRSFMEAVFIAAKIVRDSSRDEEVAACCDVIRKYRLGVFLKGGARIDNRLLAGIAIVKPSLVLLAYSFKLKLRARLINNGGAVS